MRNFNSSGIAIVRVVLGVIMLAHGIQKFAVYTVAGFEGVLGELGVPFAGLLAYAVPIVEVGAGVLLILGLFTRVAGVLTVGVGLAALFTMHIANGLFVDDGGYELVLLIAAAGAGVALLGGGRFSLDAVVPFGKKPVAQTA
ncbi:DoxX family protein [Leucobacter viscericola]|uniref:DoxX family protein n=1 Tax=Leucobacter viscericola TaxID=2714935 RepID=A0A6G7XG28_9MICO|nr:DoxX family protein [Leucobacter viscericola]QIK63554.1 DoxX family protein [Leucobacter viscericola]